MELVMLQDLGLLLQVWAFACLLLIQGSTVSSVEEGKPGYVSNVNVLIGEAAAPVAQPIGIGLQPPFAVPSSESAPVPQTTKGLPSFTSPSPSTPNPNPFVPPPASTPDPVLSTPPIPPSANPPSTPTPNPLVPPPASTSEPVPLTPPIPPSADPPSKPSPNPFVPPPSSSPDPTPLTPPIPPSASPPSKPTPPFVPPPSSSPDLVPLTPPIPPSADPPSKPTPNPFVPPPSSSPDLVPVTPPIPPSADPPSKPTPNPFVPPPSSSPDLVPLTPPIPPSADPPSKSTPNPFVPPPSSSPDLVPLTPPIPPSADPPSKPTPNPFVPPPSSSPDPVPLTPPFTPANPPSKPTPSPFVPPPSSSPDPVPFTPPIPPSPQPPEHPPSTVHAPAPKASPSSSSPPDKQPHPPVSKPTPPTSDRSIAPVSDDPHSAIAPVSNVPAPRGMPESPPSSHSVFPKEPPSLPPDVSPRPEIPGNSPPAKPILHEPPASPPVQNASPFLAPPPRISKKTAAIPVLAPTDKIAPIHAPLSHFPAEAPTASNTRGHPNHAPPPLQLSNSRSPRPHRSKVFNTSSAPPPNVTPPSPGSSMSSSPHSSVNNTYSPIPSPSPASPSNRPQIPSVQPKISPSGSSQRSPNMPLLPPMRALPPPPPNTDCAPLTCTEPLAYGPPEAPCVCVLPIQVGLRLSVALYTFFPLVSELAAEVAAGVFMKQSQVRIMGANAAGDDTEKTVVLIDLLPLGEKFDDTTAYLTFGRFWHKQVVIKTSIFGEYDVLYVRYPGLPPSPPLPPSTIAVIPSKPYPGHGNNGRTIQPLGVDVSRNQHKRGLSRSILAIIILSCFIALILVCAAAWVFLFRDRQSAFRPDPTPPTTIRSLAKSSGIAGSRTGSAVSSPSFSLGSSMAAYTGSAKTYSSNEIDKATDFFNEANVLGEGGFGRVYSGVLEDGAKVAIKILKRYDQQSGREFLAEVEMLSRLHHRNLVKLIGICVEDRTRCLVYELVPNGSVESHLHGIDKERSPLDWCARLKIALGSARALAYLHEDSSPRVIHRDFKASNILLEDDFTPKVSDFGLARAALDEDNKHISTRVMGTFGYVAPEYAMTGHLLVKSDVYSYGVVLLELLTGKKPVDMSQQPGQENLVAWARPLLTSREGLESIIDQSVAPDVPFDSISKVAAIASMCVQPEVSHRPFMGEVVQALKLICSECDAVKELPSRSCSQEDLSMVMEARNSTNSNPLPAPLLSPHSTVSDYDYLLDIERDLSMSELLSSSAKLGREDSESFRRHSSSGPLRTSTTKPLWRTMRRLSRGSVSEHGVMFKLWHGTQ